MGVRVRRPARPTGVLRGRRGKRLPHGTGRRVTTRTGAMPSAARAGCEELASVHAPRGNIEMAGIRTLNAVGYWRPSEEVFLHRSRASYGGGPRPTPPGDGPRRRLPHPADLVRQDWDPVEIAAVVAYLRSGKEWVRYNGWSYCRFGCGIVPPALGDRDLTDGVWVWPEGLAHYVEAHTVRLPEEFLHHMRERDWRMTSEPIARWGDLAPADRPVVDTGFWTEWSARSSEEQPG